MNNKAVSGLAVTALGTALVLATPAAAFRGGFGGFGGMHGGDDAHGRDAHGRHAGRRHAFRSSGRHVRRPKRVRTWRQSVCQRALCAAGLCAPVQPLRVPPPSLPSVCVRRRPADLCLICRRMLANGVDALWLGMDQRLLWLRLLRSAEARGRYCRTVIAAIRSAELQRRESGCAQAPETAQLWKRLSRFCMRCRIAGRPMTSSCRESLRISQLHRVIRHIAPLA